MTDIDKQSQDYDTTKAWKAIALALGKIQNKIPKLDDITDAGKLVYQLIQELLKADLPLIDKEELSIVYQRYGTSNPKLIACKGEITKYEKQLNQTTTINPENNKLIKCVIDSKCDKSESTNNYDSSIIYLKTQNECAKAGFNEYNTVLIVPMRLNKNKNIGAFIMHSKRDNAYSLQIQEIMDILSDRMAFFIRVSLRRRRSQYFDIARRKILEGRFERECDLLKKTVELLQQWYIRDDVYILIRNSLDIDNYFLACKENKVIEDFRQESSITKKELDFIIGEGQQRIIKAHDGILVKDPQNSLKNISPDCKSWLGSAMYHPTHKYNLGYIILHNTHTENAFEHGEDIFLNSVAEFVAPILSSFRAHKRREFIRDISKYDFGNNPKTQEEKQQKLYQNIHNYLLTSYGAKSLVIAKIDRISQKLESIYTKEKSNKIPLKDNSFQDKIHQLLAIVRDKEKKYRLQDLTITHNGNKYLIAPMHSSGIGLPWKVNGWFIIPVNHAGEFVTQSIEDISDALGTRLNIFDRRKRTDIINEFGKEVSKKEPEGINQKEILELARKYIAKAMNTENLYIALYDHKKNEISFPLALKDNKEVTFKSRQLDNKQQGKTEAIILKKKHILHHTREESITWYKAKTDRKEFIDDPFASWIGVPIFSPKEKNIAGVIAAYHPIYDYVFLDSDVFFLQNVANQVSGLLRILMLSEEIKKQIKVAEEQHKLSIANVSHDLIHRLNNDIASINMNNEEAILKLSKKDNKLSDKNYVSAIIDELNGIKEILSGIAKEIGEIGSTKVKNINVEVICKSEIASIKTINKTDENNISIKENIDSNIPLIKAQEREFSTCIYSILTNAINAINKDKQKKKKKKHYIKVTVQTHSNNLIIDIEDNGHKINKEKKNELFKLTDDGKNSITSGFGLWRARSIIENIEGGTLEYIPNRKKTIKRFRISIPVNVKKKKFLVYILEDDQNMRNKFSSWLVNAGYEVKTAKNKDEMSDLINDREESPDLASLDINLTRHRRGTNVDGLSFISTIKEKHPNCKILLVTGYPEFAGQYKGNYDLLLRKSDEKEGMINQSIYIASIENLLKGDL